ncbi:MAG: hypothetical protein C0486_10905 [Erythrobacter sp.]|nr:hypothetical protein [Erythrobacter sp.]MBA4082841.1 hypothetical protein [Erythrobacter sp.]
MARCRCGRCAARCRARARVCARSRSRSRSRTRARARTARARSGRIRRTARSQRGVGRGGGACCGGTGFRSCSVSRCARRAPAPFDQRTAARAGKRRTRPPACGAS